MQPAEPRRNALVNCTLLCILLLLGVACPPNAIAQAADGAIPEERSAVHSSSGVLLDPSGAAIANAEVTLLGTKAEVIAQTRSDAVGAFYLDNIAPGKYTLNL